MIIKGGFLTMGTKRVGMARVKALINNNVNQISRKYRRIIHVDGTRTIDASESGSTLMWTKGTSHTITLPACEAGLNFKIVIKVSSNNLHKIAAASGDCFFGQVVVFDNADDKHAIQTVTYASATGTPADFDHIAIDGNASDTGSGAGSVIELECIDGDAWRVSATLMTTGTPSSIAAIYAG
jgi:hypothetical protein